MAENNKLATIVVNAVEDTERELFIINDINMDVGPSNIHVFDDNYVYKQSFLRSSAVYCYRSKYSQTKVILNFPFYIDTNEDESERRAHTEKCIKLASQLDAYPYVFIKSNRIETYISPRVKSSTGYLMFAVESIASIQSSTASNLVFLEVILNYYNHSPLASDFQFIDKRQPNMESDDQDATVENYEHLVINPPSFVSDLIDSTVWADYMIPKETKVIEKMTSAGLFNPKDNNSHHPGLSVMIDVPLIVENPDRGLQLDSDDNGTFVGPDSKVITVTDINKMENTDYTEDMLSIFNQDFSRRTEAEKRLDRSEALYGNEDVNQNLRDAVNDEKKNDSIVDAYVRGMQDDSTLSTPVGSVDLFVQYAPINLEELGISISRVEVRKTNNLISQKIGSHKHPIIQYMGKNPAEINIQFNTNIEPEYYKGDVSSKPAHTLLTSALQILDENRLLQPAAEAYNVLKVRSFSTYLLNADSAVPNSSMISAISDAQGAEELALSLVQSNSEEFLESLKNVPSGMSSMDNTDIVNMLKAASTWLKTFRKELNTEKGSSWSSGGDLYQLSKTRDLSNTDLELSVSIAKDLFSLLPIMMEELGFSTITLEYFTSYGFEKLNSENLFDIAKMNRNIKFKSFNTGKAVNNLLLPEDKYFEDIQDIYDKVLSTNNDSTKGVSLTASQYFKWYLHFASLWFDARINIVAGQKITTLGNIDIDDFSRSSDFENKLTNIMLKISRNKSEKTVSSSLNKNTFDFLNNIKTTDKYKGYLRGQNLPDLKLEDIVPEYVEGDDLVLHAIDPFFFLYSAPILGDDMEFFFFENYNVEELNPDTINKETEDLSKSEPDMMENYLGLDFEARQLKEVNYNSEEFEAYYSSVLSTTMLADSSEVFNVAPNTKVAEAIDSALVEYGYSNDKEMLDYAHKVAYIESGYGTNVYNPEGKGMGAQGLYQFRLQTVSELISNSKTKAFAGTSYQNVSMAQRDSVARKIMSDSNFRNNHKLSARMFLDLFNIMGGKVIGKDGKMDMVATYAKHHYGLGGYNSTIKVFLDTGKNVEVPQHGNAVNFYKKYSATMNKIDVNKLRGRESKSVGTQGIPFKANGLRYSATVVKIVDGDTADVVLNLPNNTTKKLRLRVAGYDTRETDESSVKFKKEYLKWGEAAKAKLNLLMPVNSKIIVNYQNIDQYNRNVGAVTNLNNQDIAILMLESGLAIVGNQYTANPLYVEAQQKAQRNKIGMWSTSDNPAIEARKEEQKQIVSDKEKPKFNVEEILSGATSNTNEGRWQKWQPFSHSQSVRLSSKFTYGGARTDMNRKSPHKGLDFHVPSGTTVISAASGKVTIAQIQRGGAGLYIKIDHGNGFETLYMHLSKLLVKAGTVVQAHQPIALSGGDPKTDPENAGGSTGAHLHYEVRFKGRAIHPYSTRYTLDKYTNGEYFKNGGNISGSLETQTSIEGEGDTSGYLNRVFTNRVGITPFNTVFNKEILARTLLRNAKDTINIGLKYSLPAIRVYMTVGNENDGLGLDTITTGVQYYEIKGIKSFDLVCNNDYSPVDVGVMTILDPSFANTDSWAALAKSGMPGTVNLDKIGTDSELQFNLDRIILKPGNKLQVRLGYGNDPNKLPIVCNAVIVEASKDNNQMLTLLLEGFGRELLGDMLGTSAEPTKLDGDHNSSTSSVLGKVISSADAICHFGHMSNYIKILYQNDKDPEERQLVPLINTGAFSFFNLDKSIFKSRVYSNIFAPEIEKVDDEFSKYFKNFFASFGYSNHQFGYPFYMYRTNAWSSCKQMEYRHPGTILKPLIFEDRMTLFYGVKEQMYIAKDLSTYTQVSAIKEIKDYQRGSIPGENIVDYYARRRERLEPVSNIFIASSSHNLLYNHIKLNGQWKTSTRVSYFTDNEDFQNKYAWKTSKVAFDDNLLPWEIREKELMMSGVHGAYTSFLYGTTDIKKEAETMYEGSIVILGNPKIKAGDYIFLDDYDNRMSGLVLVRDCIHHFDSIRGFTTEITPGAYVEPAQFMYNTLWLQLMTAFKLGAAKTRLVNSSSFSSEYKMIKDYLSVMKELRSLDGLDNLNDSGYSTLYGAYAAGGTLAGYILLKLSKQLGVASPTFKNVRTLSHIAKFGMDSVFGMFSEAHRALAAKRVKMSTIHSFYKKGSNFTKDYAKIKKASFIGSEAYQKYKKSRAGRTIAATLWKIKRNKLVGLGVGVVKHVGGPLIKAGWFAARGVLTALALSNPIGLFLEAIFALIVSYGMAKVEETTMTRQPLLIFPLLSHGRPYVAGMTGAKRNGYLSSLFEETGKTVGQVSKAAAILNANRIAKGNSSNGILRSIGQYHTGSISELKAKQMAADIQKEVSNEKEGK